MMTGLRIEVRRSQARYLWPLLVLGGGYAAVNYLQQLGDNAWLLLTAAVVDSVRLTGPLLAGIAAWAAARERRSGTRYLAGLAARPAGTVAFAELGAVVLWALLGYAVVAALIAGQGLASRAWGSPDLLWLAVGAAGIAVHGAIGYAVGRALPLRFVPALLVVVFYAADILAFSAGGWAASLAPAQLANVSVFDATRPWFLVAQLAWYLGLAACITAGTAVIALGGARADVVSASVGAVLMIIGLVGMGVQGGEPIARNGAMFTYRCAGADPSVCVQPAYAHALGPLVPALHQLQARLAGTPLLVRRAEQRESLFPASSRGVIYFQLATVAPGDTADVVKEVGSVVLSGALACGHEPSPAALDYGNMVQSWVTGDIASFVPAGSSERQSLRWFLAQSAAQHRAWFARHFADVRSCTLSRADFRA
jgi:hypothetical protein